MVELKHESDFKVEEYEDFYEHHYFQPLDDNDAIQAHRIFPRVGWALDIAEGIQPKSVLDLGCLEGYTALTLANKVASVKKAVGVDLSEEAITLAKKRTKLVKGHVEFYKDSLEDWLENNEEKFDLITLFEIMEHVKDPEYVIRLVDTALAPGGTVLISTPAFESPTFGKDDEQNKCHIRLYTLEEEDYEDTNKYGTLRKATSLPKQLGKERIVDARIYSELIHLRYQ
jgi:2-polyprenyl-3-methyl-5-hydroxy-6-metoxy-1,4-benzoquinol methylase